MRGGPLPEPIPQRGLSRNERENPYHNIQGPSLLTREKFGAKKSEWERFKTTDLSASVGDLSLSGGVTNMFDDDNPFNDPIQYWPLRGWVFPPSNYQGPDDPRETDKLNTVPGGNTLKLNFVYGFCGRRARSNLFYNADGKIVYHSAALGIVYDTSTHTQLFFHGHDDDITALDLHPDRVKVVTGQMGKDPKILIWSSRADAHSASLVQLCQIQGDHRRAIIGVSFSRNGQYVAAMGKDNNRSLAVYKWAAGRKLSDMRIGIDKGHNDEVYNVAFNPYTDHVVAVGRKYIRFFGIKEGVDETGARDTKLSSHESRLWAKKGVFGKKGTAQDIMCVAFGSDGITYAGTEFGFIYRFAEQTMDLAVKAHAVGKVTAMCFNPHTDELISSGDDGWLYVWAPASWTGRSAPSPVQEMDLNSWVSPDMRGLPIPLESLSEKEPSHRGSPAAAHSIHVDEHGRVLVGTVCNEIFEIDFESSEPPICYMQGHYEETWGLATHPSRLEFCTAAEDCTLRIWDLPGRTQRAMCTLTGPGRCAAYSADGSMVAVGLGSGGKAKGKISTQHDGRWLVLEADTLHVIAEPPKIRSQRISDIKFSPDGSFVAVCCADNFIDLYSLSGSPVVFERKRELKGHSSYVRMIDWSADSTALQSVCGAHELLFWKLYNEEGRFQPHQEKFPQKMKDIVWESQSCIFGWPLRGVWPEDSDGTDINAAARSNSAKTLNAEQMHVGLLATGDDLGKVKIFRYPCVVPRAQHRPYSGHSSHVTNVAFTSKDEFLISTGGQDRAVFQWEVVST